MKLVTHGPAPQGLSPESVLIPREGASLIVPLGAACPHRPVPEPQEEGVRRSLITRWGGLSPGGCSVGGAAPAPGEALGSRCATPGIFLRSLESCSKPRCTARCHVGTLMYSSHRALAVYTTPSLSQHQGTSPTLCTHAPFRRPPMLLSVVGILEGTGGHSSPMDLVFWLGTQTKSR